MIIGGLNTSSPTKPEKEVDLIAKWLGEQRVKLARGWIDTENFISNLRKAERQYIDKDGKYSQDALKLWEERRKTENELARNKYDASVISSVEYMQHLQENVKFATENYKSHSQQVIESKNALFDFKKEILDNAIDKFDHGLISASEKFELLKENVELVAEQYGEESIELAIAMKAQSDFAKSQEDLKYKMGMYDDAQYLQILKDRQQEAINNFGWLSQQSYDAAEAVKSHSEAMKANEEQIKQHQKSIMEAKYSMGRITRDEYLGNLKSESKSLENAIASGFTYRDHQQERALSYNSIIGSNPSLKAAQKAVDWYQGKMDAGRHKPLQKFKTGKYAGFSLNDALADAQANLAKAQAKANPIYHTDWGATANAWQNLAQNEAKIKQIERDKEDSQYQIDLNNFFSQFSTPTTTKPTEKEYDELISTLNKIDKTHNDYVQILEGRRKETLDQFGEDSSEYLTARDTVRQFLLDNRKQKAVDVLHGKEAISDVEYFRQTSSQRTENLLQNLEHGLKKH